MFCNISLHIITIIVIIIILLIYIYTVYINKHICLHKYMHYTTEIVWLRCWLFSGWQKTYWQKLVPIWKSSHAHLRWYVASVVPYSCKWWSCKNAGLTKTNWTYSRYNMIYVSYSFYFLGLYTPSTSSNLHKPNTSTFIPNINHLRDVARWGTNSEMQRFAVWTHAEEEAERIRCQGSAQVCPGRCRCVLLTSHPTLT